MKGIKDMAKLVFNYGAMGSSKTANALMVAYNYEERGQHALILKAMAFTARIGRARTDRTAPSSPCSATTPRIIWRARR